MARRPGTKRKGREGSWLPEPPTRKEAPALRARLIAAMARGLAPIWRWLQGSRLGRFVAYYFIPRRGVGLHPRAADNPGAIRIKPSLYLPPAKKKHQAQEEPLVNKKHQAQEPEVNKNQDQAQEEEASPAAAARKPHVVDDIEVPLNQAQEEAPPAAAARKRHVVDDIEVPLDQELLYEEYCRRALKNVQGKSSLCHMCIFEGQRTPNGIVRNGGMIIHCRNYHDGAGMECEEKECQVRFKENKHRERRLHKYFSHELPKVWWPKRR